jgi:hypothetical protein
MKSLGRRKLRESALYLAGMVVCGALAWSMWGRIAEAVEASYASYAFDPEASLATRLNHANTYYWYARYRKNSQPEFELAQRMAEEVLRELPDSLKAFPDRMDEFATLRNQAKTLATYCAEQRRVSQLNIASYVPMYLELMAHDVAFMEQDCEASEVETRAANRAIDVILDLTSPEKNAKIGERPLFALVNAQGESKDIHESIIQKLNSESKFYTISDHELVKILGAGATYERAFNDSSALVAIADFFGAKSIALIELINNDKVNGIHYYGMRYNVWQEGENVVKDGVYTEYFLRNRIFNQMTIFKIPLFLFFMGLLGMLGLALAWISAFIPSWHFSWYAVWISLTGAVVAAVGAIDFLFMEFLNPLPSDYYATDEGEVWRICLPLVLLVLPQLFNYLLFGRLDKHLKSFKSRLDERGGLFVLCSGGFVAIPLVWANYRIMRFGIEADTLHTLLLACALFLGFAWSISRWMHIVLNFPEKVDLRRRVLAVSTLAGLCVYAYSCASQLLVGASLSIHALELAGVCVVPWLLEALQARISHQNKKRVVDEVLRPVHLEQLKLHHGQWRLGAQHASMLRVTASKSVNAADFLQLAQGTSEVEWFVVDFSQRGDGTVHYFPFAKAFEFLYSFKRYNDVTEQSRLLGNILGKLVSTVTSAGEYLIDESDPKPRNVHEVAAMVERGLRAAPFGLIFQHPDKVEEEDLELMEALLSALASLETVPPIAFCAGPAYSLQRRFDAAIQQHCAAVGEEPVLFQMTFKDVARSVLERKNIEPLSRVVIEERLIATEIDQSPVLAMQALDALLRSPLVFTNVNGQLQLGSISFDFEHNPMPTDSLSDLEPDIQELLQCAAIASSDSGIFHVDLVTSMVDMPRKSVLHALYKLQSLHLVIDLQDDHQTDLFQFSDLDVIKSCRREDDHERQQVSQQVREYYRAYIAYFLPYNDWAQSKAHLVSCLTTGAISERELSFLAQRVLRMGGVNYCEELLEFVLTKVISDGLTAHFEGAQQLIRRYRERYSSATELSSRIAWLEFNLAIEQGAFEYARELYKSGIRSDAENRKLSPADMLVCVRYCFGDFMYADNAAHGKELNEAVLEDPNASAIDVLRAQFYRIKLIPNKDKILDEAAQNRGQVQHVVETFEQLISSAEGLVQEQELNRKSRDLFKEILNDCMGYHADFIWAAKERMPLFGLDLEMSKSSFDRLKSRRLALESEINEHNWLDASWLRRGTDIDYRGLCYTYNYVQRAFANLGLQEDSIRVGQMSFLLNSFVGDHVGKQACAGALSKSHLECNRLDLSLYWAEQSVAYAHLHGVFLGNAMKSLAQACAARADFSAFKQLSRAISRRHVVKHFDDAMPLTEKRRLLLNGSDLLRASLEAGSRFYWGRPIDHDFLAEAMDVLNAAYPFSAGSEFRVGTQLIRVIRCREKLGKIELDLQLSQVIGATNVVPMGLGHNCIRGLRGNSMVWLSLNSNPMETDVCGFVVQLFPNQTPWHLVTAHPGCVAPPLPTTTQGPEDYAESEDFWNRHAFVETSQVKRASKSS